MTNQTSKTDYAKEEWVQDYVMPVLEEQIMEYTPEYIAKYNQTAESFAVNATIVIIRLACMNSNSHPKWYEWNNSIDFNAEPFNTYVYNIVLDRIHAGIKPQVAQDEKASAEMTKQEWLQYFEKSVDMEFVFEAGREYTITRYRKHGETTWHRPE